MVFTFLFSVSNIVFNTQFFGLISHKSQYLSGALCSFLDKCQFGTINFFYKFSEKLGEILMLEKCFSKLVLFTLLFPICKRNLLFFSFYFWGKNIIHVAQGILILCYTFKTHMKSFWRSFFTFIAVFLQFMTFLWAFEVEADKASQLHANTIIFTWEFTHERNMR